MRADRQRLWPTDQKRTCEPEPIASIDQFLYPCNPHLPSSVSCIYTIYSVLES